MDCWIYRQIFVGFENYHVGNRWAIHSSMPEYSISQLGTFEECALQYRLIYIDRIKRYEEGVEAFLGQRFHDAMEWLYKERAFRIVPL